MAEDTSSPVPSKRPRIYGDGRRRVVGANLGGMDLAQADLTQLAFKGVDLSGANLAGADLVGATLDRVDLSHADLSGADLRGVALGRVDLSEANLSGANFCGADLKSVVMRGASVVGTEFSGCSGEDIDLAGADLTAAQFDGSMLRGVSFEETQLVQTSFDGACVERCQFTDVALEVCTLSGARLVQVRLTRANLSGCAVKRASFRRVRFDSTSVSDSSFSATVMRKCTGLSEEQTQDLRTSGAIFESDLKDPAAADGSPAKSWVGRKVRLADLEGLDANPVLASTRWSQVRWPDATLKGAVLANAELRRVELQGADLREADLRSAEFVGADLSGADLRGADLRGAILDDTKLDGVKLDRADLRGVALDDTSLTEATFEGADLRGASLATVKLSGVTLAEVVSDGCRIEEGTLKGATFTGGSLRGATTDHCDLRDTTWSGVDLQGSFHLDGLFAGASFEQCDLRGARLLKTHLSGFTAGDSRVTGSVLVRCHRLSADERTRLEEGGARIERGPVAKVAHAVRERPKLRLGLAVGLVAAAAIVLAVACTPSVWPSPVLMAQMADMENPAGNETCERYLELGRILRDRNTARPGRQARLLLGMDECYQGAADQDERIAVLERCRELAPPDDFVGIQATESLGWLFHTRGETDKAEGIIRVLLDETASPTRERVNALISLQEIYLAQGIDRKTDPRWSELQSYLGNSILVIRIDPTDRIDHLGVNVAELVFLGETELATQVIERLAMKRDNLTLWPLVNEASDRLWSLSDAATAARFVDGLRRSEDLSDHPIAPLLVYSTVDLLLTAGEEEEAEKAQAILDDWEPAGGAVDSAVATLIAARVALAEEEPAQALAALDALGEPGVELFAIDVVLRVEAHLAMDDEPAGVDALFVFLEGVDDSETAERILDRVLANAPQLRTTRHYIERSENIQNPALLALFGGGSGQRLNMLGERALTDALSAEDPDVQALLRGGDPDTVRQAVQILYENAQTHGHLEEVLVSLRKMAADDEDTAGSTLGLMLVEYSLYHRGDADTAKQHADELGLWTTVGDEDRGLLLEVAALVALSAGDEGEVERNLEQALALKNPVGNQAALSISEQYSGWLVQAGRYEDALAVAKQARTRVENVEDRVLCREQVVASLVALDRKDELAEEIEKLSAQTSACSARLVEIQAHEMVGRPFADLTVLEQECSRDGITATDRLQAAEYLLQRDAFAMARTIMDGTSGGDPDLRPQRVRVLAALLSAEGRIAEGLVMLDEEYARAAEPWEREMLVQTKMDMLANAEDVDGLIAAYRSFAKDHGNSARFGLWSHCAQWLLQLGASARLSELGEDAAWEERLGGPIQTARVRDLTEAGDFASATKVVKEIDAEDLESWRLEDLAISTAQTGRSTGDAAGAIAVLEALLELAPARDDARVTLVSETASLLTEVGRDDEAMALCRELLEEDLAPSQLQVLAEFVPTIAGQTLPPTEIEALLDRLDKLGLQPEAATLARLNAADGLVQRNEPAEAMAMVSGLRGKPVSAEVVRSKYHVFVSAHSTVGQGPAEVFKLYPPEKGEATCVASVVALQGLEWNSPDADALVASTTRDCEPGHLDIWDLQILADNLCGRDDASAALALIEKHGSAIPAADRGRLGLVRARVATATGDMAASREELLALADEDADLQLAAEAMAILISHVYPQDGTPIQTVEAQADRVIERVGKDTGEARQIRSQMVELERAQGRLDRAIEQQEMLLASLPPGVGDEQAWELSRMARLQFDKGGVKAAKTILVVVDDAIAATTLGGCCLDDLLPLKAALEIASGGRADVILGGLLEAHPGMDEASLTASTAMELEGMGLNDLAQDLQGAP